MIFFSSDHHFGHENVIEYCNRPFSSSVEMDETMIERWNERVMPGDTVYYLGDFTLNDFPKFNDIFTKLNGNIYFMKMPFHHDRRWQSDKRASFLSYIPPLHVLENVYQFAFDEPRPLVLCHYPIAEWDRKHYGSVHLHGHSHGNYSGTGMILDVGVDNHNFYPISINDVKWFMENENV